VRRQSHLLNFGDFATPERRIIFDINDLDETLPAPWEWNVKRLAASVVLACRSNGFSEDCARDAVRSCVRSYRQRMAEYSDMPVLDVWYSSIDIEKLLPTISDKTVWRWLNEDAIRPWQHRCWIFPRDPNFVTKAGRILDLYAREWEGKPLRSNGFVISADEKTSIQARIRRHPTLPPRPGQVARVEHEYRRVGAWAYIAALDVHRAKVFGRCEKSTGIKPFDRLVAQVMSEPPYRKARRVFWIADNGSSHRGQTSIRRLQAAYPNLVPVHTPVHASWLNQIEIYFSIVQRKALTPNDFSSPEEVNDRLLRFQDYYETIASPFDRKFTRNDLAELEKKIDRVLVSLRPAA
jgi:hypothetical protein